MKVLVLDELAEDYLALLAPTDGDANWYSSLPAGLNRVDVVLGQPDRVLSFLQAGGRTDWIQSTWAGVAPLIEPLRAKSVLLTGLKGIFGPGIAEYVFAYLLQDVRKTRTYAEAQSTGRWDPVMPDTLQGKQLVVLGTGDIGSHVASLGKAFGMHTLGVSHSGRAQSAFDTVCSVTDLHLALATADYVVSVLPDTKETQGLVNQSSLASMPAHAMFVNVGRGQTVDETALAQTLASGGLRRAVLDVFQVEPLNATSPLWGMANVDVTPHVAAVSYPTDVSRFFTENLRRYTHGEPLLGLIDLDRGY